MKIKIKLSSNGLFGSPAELEMKPYSFAQVHRLVSAFEVGDMKETFSRLVEVLTECCLTKGVDFYSFTTDEITETLMLCHQNFIGGTITAKAQWEDTNEVTDELLDIALDVKYAVLQLADKFAGADLQNITITTKSKDVLVGTAVRIKDWIEAKLYAESKLEQYKKLHISAFNKYKAAQKLNQLGSLSDKIREEVEQADVLYGESLDFGLMVAHVVSWKGVKAKDFAHKVELANDIPPHALIKLQSLMEEEFYHGPVQSIKLGGRACRVRFSLASILSAFKSTQSTELEVSLGKGTPSEPVEPTP